MKIDSQIHLNLFDAVTKILEKFESSSNYDVIIFVLSFFDDDSTLKFLVTSSNKLR